MAIMIRTLAASLAFTLASCALAAAQTAERRDYAASPTLRRDLEARDFDVAQVEGVVNGIARSAASGDPAPILELTAPQVRVTEGASNTVVPREQLRTVAEKLLKAAQLREAVMDESRMIVRGDEVGLAGGEFWIAQTCADAACSKKNSAIVTINLP